MDAKFSLYTSPASHFVPLRLALRGYSVASLPRNFHKKKCVPIDSKWSKTHRNAKKKIYPFDAGKGNLTYPCGRFAPSGFTLTFSVASLATYPMTLPGSQGVSMPSFITIRSKLWALEGYKHTYIVRDRRPFII